MCIRDSIKPILDELSKYGNVTYKRIYGDWTKTNNAGWKGELLQNSITPIQQFSYTHGKNATDSAMIIDAMDMLYTSELEGFCLVSSDSDFTKLASRLREKMCIRDSRKGYRYEFSQIDEMICNARPFAYRLDVDDEELFNPGNMIHKIRKKCFQLNGKIPETPGEIFRCIQECMAFKCRQALEERQEETGREFSRIRCV